MWTVFPKLTYESIIGGIAILHAQLSSCLCVSLSCYFSTFGRSDTCFLSLFIAAQIVLSVSIFFFHCCFISIFLLRLTFFPRYILSVFWCGLWPPGLSPSFSITVQLSLHHVGLLYSFQRTLGRLGFAYILLSE